MDKQINILLVSTSATDHILIDSSEFEKQIKYVENLYNVKTDVILNKNNRDGLPKLYNKILNDERLHKSHDFIILIHGDVLFKYENFIKHLFKIENKYDLIGVAGTKKMKLSMTPLTWFTASHEFPEARYGKITHTQFIEFMGESFFNELFDPLTTDCNVSAIDGLCMILNKSIIESDIQFDEERFNFDFYDLDFCLNCILKYKFKIGVMVEPVLHESVGTSVLTESFSEVENRFRDKWKLH